MRICILFCASAILIAIVFSASAILFAICSRSSFCDALRSAAAFSSLKKDLFEVNTSLTFLSSVLSLSFKSFNVVLSCSLRSFTVLVSTASSVLNLSSASLRLCISMSNAPVFDVVVLSSVDSSLAIVSFCLLMYVSSESILLLMISIRCVTVSSARFCSRCALDRKPKIPIDVIQINTMTAMVRYVLRSQRVCFQFLYSHDAVTSLPTSNTDPIITTGQNAPGKMVASPITE